MEGRREAAITRAVNQNIVHCQVKSSLFYLLEEGLWFSRMPCWKPFSPSSLMPEELPENISLGWTKDPFSSISNLHQWQKKLSILYACSVCSCHHREHTRLKALYSPFPSKLILSSVVKWEIRGHVPDFASYNLFMGLLSVKLFKWLLNLLMLCSSKIHCCNKFQKIAYC